MQREQIQTISSGKLTVINKLKGTTAEYRPYFKTIALMTFNR
jgi:hypothetical protein